MVMITCDRCYPADCNASCARAEPELCNCEQCGKLTPISSRICEECELTNQFHQAVPALIEQVSEAPDVLLDLIEDLGKRLAIAAKMEKQRRQAY